MEFVTSIIQVLRILFTGIFVLFLPGFAVAHLIYDMNSTSVTELLIVSVALSMAIVPLVLYYANLAGIPIHTVSVAVILSGIVLIAVTAIVIRYKSRKKA